MELCNTNFINLNFQTILSRNQPFIVTEGKIFSEIRMKTEYVIHTVRLYHGDVPEAKSLKIENVLDIRSTSNFELVMCIESDLKNRDREFFTDLNGFQVCYSYFTHILYISEDKLFLVPPLLNS